jgi:hypothetical protein
MRSCADEEARLAAWTYLNQKGALALPPDAWAPCIAAAAQQQQEEGGTGAEAPPEPAPLPVAPESGCVPGSREGWRALRLSIESPATCRAGT